MLDFDSSFVKSLGADRTSPYGHIGQNRTTNTNSRRNNKLDEVMAEFRLNGLDSPYNPEEEEKFCYDELGFYRRRRSSPGPSSATWCAPSPQFEYGSSWPGSTPKSQERSSQQLRDDRLDALLDIPQQMLDMPVTYLEQYAKPEQVTECRFCKSNGESLGVYSQHRLKDKFGRIVCPVLRAFTCPRCHATGDTAHTVKYCPLTSNIERQHATAMLRSVRLASERRRLPRMYIQSSEELDIAWTMLEKKLCADNQERINKNNNMLF